MVDRNNQLIFNPNEEKKNILPCIIFIIMCLGGGKCKGKVVRQIMLHKYFNA